jgi:predicted dehydrogenase
MNTKDINPARTTSETSLALTRRGFMKTMVGGIGLTLTAASYSRVVGANDRISIGVIGSGSRGIHVHMKTIHDHAKTQNVEVSAVADPWGERRREAAAAGKEWFGRTVRTFISYRDLLALKDIDAVMISSCDHQHTTHLEASARAGKHIYCEKPLAKDLAGLVRACQAVREAGVVTQIGTQLRSFPSFTGVRELYKTGILGKVARIEQRRNATRPYWYDYIREARAEDVDWDEFLMHLPKRPFDPVRFTGWYGYRETSDGPVPGLGSHFLDLVHYITGAKYPASCVCLGGTYTWKDNHQFTAPDQVQALWEYPEGFMVSYSTNFGNDSDNTMKILGDQGTVDMTNWNEPFVSAEGGSQNRGVIRGKKPVDPVDRPDHWLDWLQCMRSGKTPNAPIEAGYQHAIACLMAVQSMTTGQRMIYDPVKSEIRPG